MGRPPREPGSKKKDIWFTPYQLRMLNALRELSPYGKPSFTALVVRAIDTFIEGELAKPEVREQVAKYTAETQRVVALRDVSKNGS